MSDHELATKLYNLYRLNTVFTFLGSVAGWLALIVVVIVVLT